MTVAIFKLDLSRANLPGATLMLLAGSLSFIGVGVMGSVLPLLFPERGSQMTHVIIAVLLLVSGVYYPVEVLPSYLQKLAVLQPCDLCAGRNTQRIVERHAHAAVMAVYLANAADGRGGNPGGSKGVWFGRTLCQAHREAAPEWMM